MTAPLDVEAWFRRLHEAGIDYVVIGGFAVIAHGVVRATKDLDVVPSPDPENLRRLADLLADLDARQVGQEELGAAEFPLDPTRAEDLAQGGNFLVETALGRLDVMQWVPAFGEDAAYEHLARSAVEGEAFGVVVRVASLADLRTMKRAAGRPQDMADLADLATAHPEHDDEMGGP